MRNNLTELQLGAIPPKYIWRCPATRCFRCPQRCYSLPQSKHQVVEVAPIVGSISLWYFMLSCRAHDCAGVEGGNASHSLSWLPATWKLRLSRNLSMWPWACRSARLARPAIQQHWVIMNTSLLQSPQPCRLCAVKSATSPLLQKPFSARNFTCRSASTQASSLSFLTCFAL